MSQLNPTRRIDLGGVAFRVLVAILYLFLLAPLLIVVVISFSSNQYISFPPQGFTWHWYEILPTKSLFTSGLQTSLITSSVTTLIVLAVGVPASLALQRFEFPGRSALSAFFLSPLLVPTIVLALGLVLVLGPIGLTNTYAGIVIGHVSITLPYVIRTTLMSLETSDTSSEEAARVLGADGARVFWTVTLPIILPGIIAGAVMAFIVSFDELVIALFVAQSGKPTLPVQLMNYVATSADAAVASLSVVLIIFSALIVVVLERLVGLRRALR
ncbi:ABC transporter permease [Cryobacterium tepidiphilum]|uniref:ABC transporter permease n=1 Tax=Cryobacterium tepidiphilum TaxID=2486026 RepID=UPI001F2FEC57|nr:ABC transporter permease [Cryobacterium tepidiphilum]